MSRLAVVAYPVLSRSDGEWIERIRERYDPMASQIAAHVTLVFPTDVTEAAVLAQVTTVLRSSRPIAVMFRRATTFRDIVDSGYHVFLLAEEGHTELAQGSSRGTL